MSVKPFDRLRSGHAGLDLEPFVEHQRIATIPRLEGRQRLLRFGRAGMAVREYCKRSRTVGHVGCRAEMRGGKCRDVRQKRKIIEQDVAQRPPPGARRVGGERTLVG